MNKDNALNKDDVIEKLNEEICCLDERFKADKCGNDLILYFYGQYRVIPICWFADFKPTKFYAPEIQGQVDCWLMTDLVMTGVAHRFYKLGIKLLEKYASRYTIQTIRDSEMSFLNFDRKHNDYFYLLNANQNDDIQTEFTPREINELKKDKNIAIDWNKAVIKEVRDDE